MARTVLSIVQDWEDAYTGQKETTAEAVIGGLSLWIENAVRGERAEATGINGTTEGKSSEDIEKVHIHP